MIFQESDYLISTQIFLGAVIKLAKPIVGFFQDLKI